MPAVYLYGVIKYYETANRRHARACYTGTNETNLRAAGIIYDGARRLPVRFIRSDRFTFAGPVLSGRGSDTNTAARLRVPRYRGVTHPTTVRFERPRVENERSGSTSRATPVRTPIANRVYRSFTYPLVPATNEKSLQSVAVYGAVRFRS